MSIDKKLYDEFGREVYRNKWDQDGNDARVGYKAEDLFAASALRTYKDLGPATEDENINDHIDFKCSKLGGIDVKAKKQSFDEGLIWIEFKNVAGDNGWLYGRANYIAFEWDDHFRLVRLIDLQVKVHDLTKKAKYVNHKSKALYNYYDRSKWGNKDLLTQVTAMDIWWITEHVIPFCNQLELDNYRERTFKRKY